MNGFQRGEEIGRGLYESILKLANIKDYKFTEGKYDRVDLHFTGNNGKTVCVEIKRRSREYEYMFMEYSKYRAMLKDLSDIKLYANFIGDKCYQFLLSDITKENGCFIQTQYCRETTANNGPYVPKRIIMIPLTLARLVLTNINNKWV